MVYFLPQISPSWRIITLTMKLLLVLFLAILASAPVFAQTANTIPPNSPIFLEPMNSFETYLAAAIIKKKVPVTVVDDKSKADYIVTGTWQLQPAGWAKTLTISGAPQASASISIKDAKTGNLVFAYAVDKFSAARANQSTAEACAKHLKESIEKGSKNK